MDRTVCLRLLVRTKAGRPKPRYQLPALDSNFGNPAPLWNLFVAVVEARRPITRLFDTDGRRPLRSNFL
jgi:hypothetical protein